MEPFEPQPFRVVTDPQQLKAFTDPLRVRVLNQLKQRAATNQQVAAALGEPHAKVLYHVRFLLDAGLIRLVDQRIKGGNVEKYYRAVARLFGLRPDEDTAAAGLVGAAFEGVRQEVAASEQAWPDQPVSWETRRVRLPPARADEFYRRFTALVAEYWGGPASLAEGDAGAVAIAEEDPAAPTLCFAAVLYRDPAESAAGGDAGGDAV